MKKLFTAIALSIMSACHAQTPQDNPHTSKEKTMHIQIRTPNNDIITADLTDNPTTRDFYQALPLTLTLENYGAVEKISYGIPKLSTQNAPKSHSAQTGDLTYYAPWGNLAIFTGNFGSASGLVYMGKITQGLETLAALPNKSEVVVEARE